MENLLNGNKHELVKMPNKLNLSAHVNRFFGTNKNGFRSSKQVEIILALDDGFVIGIENNEYKLDKDDIFIVNAGELHYINKRGSKKISDMLMITVPIVLFDSYYQEINKMKFTNRLIRQNNQTGSLYDRLLKYLVKLVSALHDKEQGYEFECMSYINSCFSLLIKYNNVKTASVEESGCCSDVNQKRIERIVNMINENFANNITLTEIADKEGLDIYYLSHFIKKYLGISFRQYVNKLKLDKAVDYMFQTNKKMIDICMESGYSDYRYFYKAFTDRYQCNPSRFREKFREGAVKNNVRNLPEEGSMVSMDEEQSFGRLEKYLEEMNGAYILEA
ncbi:MAG: AraC family transcriptional regulator [Christensenella sp.]|nr:AraC family transcriptional regulator [Christensenella sp.]